MSPSSRADAPVLTDPQYGAQPAPLILRGQEVGATSPAIMAIINRTTDSFFEGARQFDEASALAAAEVALRDGAQIVDIGGVRAGTGPEVTAEMEIDRVVPFIARLRRELPELLISVDTWRAEVAKEAARAGADLINDTWAGHDPRLVEVAAAHGTGVVCSHTGGLVPRTDPYRAAYYARAEQGEPIDAIVRDVTAHLSKAAERAVAAGVPRASVLIDPTQDFGKNSWQSLHLVRNTRALTALGFPVLMAFSRKDFVGETLGLEANDRLEGTLAATSIAAWLGARVLRAHDVLATRRTLDMVATLRGDLAPVRVRRAAD